MPTPIGHGLAGLAVANAGRGRTLRPTPALFLGAAFLACLPDADLALGFLIGDPDRFHHGPAHSLAFAAVIAVVTAVLSWRLETGRLRLAFIAFAAVASHGFLDMLRTADTPRAGVQYLWPLSQDFMNLPWHILYHAPELDAFTPSVAALYLVRNAVAEIVIVGPFLALTVLWRKFRRRPLPDSVQS